MSCRTHASRLVWYITYLPLAAIKRAFALLCFCLRRFLFGGTSEVSRYGMAQIHKIVELLTENLVDDECVSGAMCILMFGLIIERWESSCRGKGKGKVARCYLDTSFVRSIR
jgi:hypothetical protein